MFRLALRDDLVGNSIVADWLKRLEEVLITSVYRHVAFAFLPSPVSELTKTQL